MHGYGVWCVKVCVCLCVCVCVHVFVCVYKREYGEKITHRQTMSM